ncbi:solute carrier organic anion transporter family member 1B3-like [Eublepharis macularius]|uniref:Solute carrier organic anion transporter family member n=1 Tax=Eublepharis macularius TaxID=481883 RepID=A0AA97JWS8_EUBMA|nr:solute carrier organic anion transporter family member 1B3-like [Eublepharis macularius]
MTMQVDPDNASESSMEVDPSHQPLEGEAYKELPVKKKSSCCTGLKAFLAALSFAYFSKSFSAAIMKSSFTQLERRFGISSSTAGFMDGGFEMGNLLVISFVSYFGAKLHRPRIIALGCFIMSLGSFLATTPHFFMGHYKYETLSHSSDNATSYIPPCSGNQIVTGLEGIPDCEKETTSYMWIYVFLGNILRGIGETPVIPLGISYLDDFSKEENTPLYIGILHTIAMTGPMAGFLLGSLFAKLYVDIGFVDLGTISITPNDSRWVGAWWLGFLVGGVINLISAIPFCFLPKSLNGEDEPSHVQKLPDAAKLNGHQTPRAESQEAVKWTAGLKDFFKSLKRALGNRMYIVLLCASLLQFNSFIGYMTYQPKYIEQQYGQSASKSNFIIGLVVLPAVSFGLLLGGFLMKKYKLDMIAATKMAFGTSFLAFLISTLYIILGCENHKVAGLTVPYNEQSVVWHAGSLSSTCNSNCNCGINQWDPVCGTDGITYVSACFAGCKNLMGSGKNTVFHNCSCIENVGLVRRNLTAILGECPKSDDCSRKFIYFIAVKLISSFLYAVGGTPFYMIMIRCVNKDLKSLAVGLYMLIMRTLAGIPAPVYFGAVIDRTCLKWAKTSCGKPGACRLYDATAYRYSFMGLIIGLRAPSYLLGFLFFWLVKKHFGRKEVKATENGGKENGPLSEEARPNGTERVADSSEAEKETSM